MTKEYFAEAFKGTNFGSTDYVQIVRQGLLKVATHYHNGSTLNRILTDLGYKKHDKHELTELGRKVLYQLYEG